jgi:hypothetical protein
MIHDGAPRGRALHSEISLVKFAKVQCSVTFVGFKILSLDFLLASDFGVFTSNQCIGAINEMVAQEFAQNQGERAIVWASDLRFGTQTRMMFCQSLKLDLALAQFAFDRAPNTGLEMLSHFTSGNSKCALVRTGNRLIFAIGKMFIQSQQLESTLPFAPFTLIEADDFQIVYHAPRELIDRLRFLDPFLST